MLTQSWSRDQLAHYADQLLLATREHASTSHAQIHFPGGPGGYGHDVDGLEGFARTFLAAGFRIAGERGDDPLGLAAWYAEGLAAGTDPRSPERWVGLAEHDQAKVEAASLALVLDLTRPWLWDQLDSSTQRNIVDYLSPAVGDETYPQINWIWFRILVQTFLRSVDGPHSETDIRDDLATHDSFTHTDGWISDGFARSYDHYVGWALHFFPTVWARMRGAEGLAAERSGTDTARLDRFLVDAVRLIGADGSPLVQGRSLLYRFAAASPFWAGVLAEVPSVPLGRLRRAATKVVQHFADHGVPGEDGILTGGWHHPWPQLLQAYSGPGSPYWAAHGLFGLAFPAEHPVWSAPDVALPVEQEDQLFTIAGPGWLASSTVADGVVRVYNHGTDRLTAGTHAADSPLYTRITYSTSTAPLQAPLDWAAPRDGTVALHHRDGRASHRGGFETIALDVAASDGVPVGTGATRGLVHWLQPTGEHAGHGSGPAGDLTRAGRITVISLARGPWELRLACAEEVDPDAVALRMSGWPVASEDRLTSRLIALSPHDRTTQEEVGDASPLHDVVVMPTVDYPIADGRWFAVLAELADHAAPLNDAEVSCRLGENTLIIEARWPDGHRSTTELVLQPTQSTEGLEHNNKENR